MLGTCDMKGGRDVLGIGFTLNFLRFSARKLLPISYLF